MYIKHERYELAELLTHGSTDDWELPEAGILSAIKLDFRGTNHNDICTEIRQRIVDRLTNIEIADESVNKLFTLRGQQCRFLSYMENRSILPETATLTPLASQLTTLIIPFGRWIGDPIYALDLEKWDQLLLKITNDMIATVVKTDSLNVDIQLITLHDLPTPPTRYIKRYQYLEEKPPRDGQYLDHEIPSRHPIQSVFIFLDPDLDEYGNAVHNPISDSYSVLFDWNSRTIPIWDHRPKDIIRDNAASRGLVNTEGTYFPDATQYIDNAIAYVHAFTAALVAPAAANALAAFEDCNDRFCKLAAVDAGITAIKMMHRGVGYYHGLILYHGEDQPESDWLNPGNTGTRPHGRCRVRVYGYKDDFTLRTCVGTPRNQGEV